MKSHLTKDFRDSFSQLSERIKRLARDNYKLWRRNPFHSFKRVGKKYPTYSVRIGVGWRALSFKEGYTMVWFWIGSHSEYERLIQKL